jgi:hypothetical protein
MPVAHLTDVTVSRLRTPGTYFDETTPAFGIRVGKNRKTWIIIRGTERVRTRIGHYPAQSLAEARIRYAYKLAGHEPLTKAEGVKATLRGIRRTSGIQSARRRATLKRSLRSWKRPY